MREHTHLPAMVGFVRKHVAEHFRANRPRPSPAVSAKLLDAALTTAERFSEHLRAASGALGQPCAGLLRRAARAIDLSWNLQVRSCKPDPLAADIVHVREDRGNGTDFAGRFGSPGGRAKMFDKNLVDAIIGGKDLDRSPAKLSLNPGFTKLGLANFGSTNLVLTRSHGSLLLDPSRCSPFMVQSKQVRSLCRPSLLARELSGLLLSHGKMAASAGKGEPTSPARYVTPEFLARGTLVRSSFLAGIKSAVKLH
jgi:hypothetical protein